MRRGLLPVAPFALSLVLASAASSSGLALGGQMLGPQKVLVVLATWGPQPFTRDEVQQAVFDQTDAFYRSESYGKASLTGTVTPWLRAFSGPAGCSIAPIRDGANAAARTAGYDPAAYDRIVYIHPDSGCPWLGVTFATGVYINGNLSRRVLAHELGHSFGLPHANTTDCFRHSCPVLEYGDPYDTMGSGVGDFSAYAKARLGWLNHVLRASRSSAYSLSALERPSTRGQAFVVTTANDQYWIEYRSEPGRDESGKKTADVGVVVRVSPSPDLRGPASDAPYNVLVANPAKRGRPELRPGDRFVYPGVFTLTVLRAASSSVRLRFKWTDKTPPAAPRFTSSVVSGQVQLDLEGGRETGSGVERYSISLDGRAAQRFGNDATDEPVQVGRPLPGTHTVRVVAVDRAGNRSEAVVRRVRVP